MQNLVLFQLNMIKGNLQTELDDFFNIIQQNGFPVREITDSAFCQARQKFSYQAYVELNRIFVDSFYEQTQGQLWHGMRLLAVDGSTIKLPGCDREHRLLEHFGKSSAQAANPCLRLSQLFDVLNDISIDVQTSPYQGHGERQLALKHLQSGHIKPGDLVLFDRGYPAFWLFSYLKGLGSHFCARMASNATSFVKAFINSGSEEAVMMYLPDRDAKKRAEEQGVDIDTKPFPVRLIRVELPCGEVEVLMTSLLNEEAFSPEMFKELYHYRWFIEEDYKTLKSRMELESFTGLTVEAVLQDIHAKVLSKNIVAVGAYAAKPLVIERHKKSKWRHEINFSKGLSKFKDTIVKLLGQLCDVTKTIVLLTVELARNTYAVRPDRQFNRNKDDLKRRKGGFHMNYKRCK
jgi:hypothetical protein